MSELIEVEYADYAALMAEAEHLRKIEKVARALLQQIGMTETEMCRTSWKRLRELKELLP